MKEFINQFLQIPNAQLDLIPTGPEADGKYHVRLHTENGEEINDLIFDSMEAGEQFIDGFIDGIIEKISMELWRKNVLLMPKKN